MQFPSCCPRSRSECLSVIVRIGSTDVQPVSSVRDLGVYIDDANMSMRTHVTAVVRSCFATLRQIRSVRRSLPRHALLTLVRALVVSKVDYCNSVLAGVSCQLQDRLQSVLNAAALLVFFSARRSERITPLLQELHWLKVPERIRFPISAVRSAPLSSWDGAVLPRWEPSSDV